jgi:HK97 family phage prohead protease
MPLQECSLDGLPGVKWGEQGTCYTYDPDDNDDRVDAVKQAMAQAIAMGDIDIERGVTLQELEQRAAKRYDAPALVVLIGPPGAGKTTWLDRELPQATRVDLEQIRREPDTDRGEVITRAINDTFALLRDGKLVAFDSTAIRPKFRARLRGVAREVGVPLHGVVFDVPLEDLLAAQTSRKHPVPDERVRELHQQFTDQLDEIYGEDWTTMETVSRQSQNTSGEPDEENDNTMERTTETNDVERSYSAVAVQYRDSGAGTNYKTLIGYPAVFNRMSEDLGGFREVIAPGAFARALERGETIKLLYDHDTAAVLASTDNGTLELREDEIGLHMWARVDMDDPDVQRVSAKLRSGIVDQMSFAFTMGEAGEEEWDYAGGVPLRTIRSVESLIEASIVAFPAYGDSKVALVERARNAGRLPELVGATDAAPDEVGGMSPEEDSRDADPRRSAYWRAKLTQRKQETSKWTS